MGMELDATQRPHRARGAAQGLGDPDACRMVRLRSSRPTCVPSRSCEPARSSTRHRCATTRWSCEVDDPRLGRSTRSSPPLRFSATPHDAPTRPRPGEHQDADTADPWQVPAPGWRPATRTDPRLLDGRAHPRPGRLLRRPLRLPSARRPRRRRHQGRAVARRPAARTRAAVRVRTGEQARPSPSTSSNPRHNDIARARSPPGSTSCSTTCAPA